jgi:antitoxin FitA
MRRYLAACFQTSAAKLPKNYKYQQLKNHSENMAQILVENLDPVILEKLETIAKEHGRSLQEELKHILQQASETATYHTDGDMTKAREAAFRIRQQ